MTASTIVTRVLSAIAKVKSIVFPVAAIYWEANEGGLGWCRSWCGG
jgi:hypothetical protein